MASEVTVIAEPLDDWADSYDQYRAGPNPAVLTGDRLLTCGEVAAWLRVDRKTVGRWAASGRLHGIRTPGGRHRFWRSEVEAALAAADTEEAL